jgi:4-hydroxy-3-methylbut-2-en-1-yl diphosphate synthase IspG/GcpE
LKEQERRVIEIVADIARLGRVLRLEINGGSLEDIFIQLTGAKSREA